MTATDELRRMLDELGVKWGNIRRDGSESNFLTEWQFDGNEGNVVATERAIGGELSVEIHRYHLTPAQAIEHTLGRGTCYDVGDITRFVCSECGCSFDLSDMDGEPTMWVKDMADTPNYCPNCGREVVDG